MAFVPLALGFAAAALGSAALFAGALGVVAVYLGCAVATRLAVRRLVVVRTVDRHEVIERHPIGLRFEVRGLRGLPVHVEVLGDGHAWHPFEGGAAELPCTIDRPGGHVLEPSPMRIRDDLGLFSRPVFGGEPASVLVLPDPEPPVSAAPRGGADLVGDPDPDGLRPYVPGTSMSRIHWPSIARGGALQERHFVTARDRLPLIVVDTGGAAEDAAVDWVARVAAGHVLALAQHGGCRVLLPGDRVPTTLTDAVGQWPAVHRRLASLETGLPAASSVDARDPETLSVSAASAPEEALRRRGPLPPGVVALSAWAGEA